jgi:hypothetical protein
MSTLSNHSGAIVAAYERAWGSGAAPPDLLSWIALHSVPEESRHATLLELACIDLEWRWKKGDRTEVWTAADYTNRYAELRDAGAFPVELIGEEYRAQARRGKVDKKTFFCRPGYDSPNAQQWIERIDRELAKERIAGHTPSANLSGGTVPKSGYDVAQTNLPVVDFSALTLRRIVGTGRSAKVYEATMNQSGSRVAAKFLRKEFLADRDAVAFFFREGAILAKLDHPRIVRLLGVGETAAGGRFLLLDWMASDLARHVGKTSWKQGLHWMIDAAEALAAAHRCGILHCDLKPSNLLTDSNGRVRLADFGLARTVAERPSESWIVEGTAPYMAPEQASPAWGEVGPRTDVFGLGAVLYALLTGVAPWTGKSVAEALTLAASGAKVPDVREKRAGIPERVAGFVMKCLAKSPSARFETIDDAIVNMRQLNEEFTP